MNYKNKKIFITGHTGFKGSWLSIWLAKLGADVCGYSLEPDTEPSMFVVLDIENKITKSVIGDILDKDLLEKTMLEFEPDIVFHLAAQPLVRESYKNPLLTYKTNVIGTLNVFEASRKCGAKVVNITTDKVYENKEKDIHYTESDNLGGYDMYSSSKACSEILSSSFSRSFGLDIITARSGNVIGGGDWARDRIVPDCIRSINENKTINLRNPNAIRPFQFILEALYGYLILGEKTFSDFESFNFGPVDSVSVLDVTKNVIKKYGKGDFSVNNDNNFHEANLLMLDINKSKKILGWYPKYDFEKSIKYTVEWYKHFYDKDIDMYKFTLSQINDYEEQWK